MADIIGCSCLTEQEKNPALKSSPQDLQWRPEFLILKLSKIKGRKEWLNLGACSFAFGQDLGSTAK